MSARLSRWAQALATDECRTQAQRDLLAVFLERAPGWEAFGTSPDDVASLAPEGDPRVEWLISVDVSAPELVLRTLRVELGPAHVAVGEDLTCQGHPLDESLQKVTAFRDDSIKALARRAADWLEAELRRPIEEHEWTGPGFQHRRWILADTGECLSWSDSQNERRSLVAPPSSIRHVRGVPI